MSAPDLHATVAVYRVKSDAASIEARAQGIAIEQSIEMPLEAVRDETVRRDIVARVGAIRDLGDGRFEVEIGLSHLTFSHDAGQLLNMLYGNSSLQDDVELLDFRLDPELLDGYPGRGQGVAGLRARAGAFGRALTCAAIKPQGLAAAAFAKLVEAFALGGVDYIKDDHGIADGSFNERVAACSEAALRAADRTGRLTHYVPNLSGSFRVMRDQVARLRDAGLRSAMVAPMIAGLSNAQALAQENPDLVLFAHPSMGGAARIAPPALMKLFRLVGADAAIFPHFGGRFGYSLQTCRAIAEALRGPWPHGFSDAMPTPAGGMTPARVQEMLDFYGSDAMLLVGGALLRAPPERLTAEAAALVRAVAEYGAAP
jgi:ribulose-bisphosphate carboxylase large chain